MKPTRFSLLVVYLALASCGIGASGSADAIAITAIETGPNAKIYRTDDGVVSLVPTPDAVCRITLVSEAKVCVTTSESGMINDTASTLATRLFKRLSSDGRLALVTQLGSSYLVDFDLGTATGAPPRIDSISSDGSAYLFGSIVRDFDNGETVRWPIPSMETVGPQPVAAWYENLSWHQENGIISVLEGGAEVIARFDPGKKDQYQFWARGNQSRLAVLSGQRVQDTSRPFFGEQAFFIADTSNEEFFPVKSPEGISSYPIGIAMAPSGTFILSLWATFPADESHAHVYIADLDLAAGRVGSQRLVRTLTQAEFEPEWLRQSQILMESDSVFFYETGQGFAIRGELK